MTSFSERLKRAWNVFTNKDTNGSAFQSYGYSYSSRPDHPFLSLGGEQTTIASIYNRIAVDVASYNIQHVRLDENDRFLEEIQSGLDECITLRANVDQTGRDFIQDAVISMLDDGATALVPIDTVENPLRTESINILSMRVGKITQWFPRYVKVRLYNDQTGQFEELTLRKDKIAIVQNPLYTVMNSPNSTMRRLTQKLALLDTVDQVSASGKLDMIIQLPYTTRSSVRKEWAENRRGELEAQLRDSKYGIGYIGSEEKIVQLNRSINTNLLDQVKYLQDTLYSQLGITAEVMNGTANEQVMLNYYNRTIEPILASLADSMRWAFLSKTARSQRQSIMYFRDPFKLAPMANIATIADTFTRNAILSSNEVRGIIGFKPVQTEEAESLQNKNLYPVGGEQQPADEGGESSLPFGDGYE